MNNGYEEINQMKHTFNSIFATSLLIGNVMGAVLTADDLKGLPGIGTTWRSEEVLRAVNTAEKGDEPYVIAELSFKPFGKKDYYQAARWVCLALQKGYHNGEAISGWMDDWEEAGEKSDLRELVKDSANHERIAQVLAAQWGKRATEESDDDHHYQPRKRADSSSGGE
jgi:hypothetical protein